MGTWLTVCYPLSVGRAFRPVKLPYSLPRHADECRTYPLSPFAITICSLCFGGAMQNRSTLSLSMHFELAENGSTNLSPNPSMGDVIAERLSRKVPVA